MRVGLTPQVKVVAFKPVKTILKLIQIYYNPITLSLPWINMLVDRWIISILSVSELWRDYIGGCVDNHT